MAHWKECLSITKKFLTALQRLGSYRILKLIAILLTFIGSVISFLMLFCKLQEGQNYIESYLMDSSKAQTQTFIQKEFTLPERVTIKTDISTLSLDEMELMRRELNTRREHLTQYCSKIKERNKTLENVLSNIIFDSKHSISWCPIYKAASSAWMKKFAAFAGALTETTIELIQRDILQVNNIVRQIYPREPDLVQAYKRINGTKKFLIVRHPIERLVSAYRDKLENIRGREYYYKRFGRHIAHRYRRFRNTNETRRIEPTFEQFLRFIVEERYFDEHWAPYFDSCEPCAISYDYILKFETLERDEAFLMQELDLPRLPIVNLRNINPQGSTTQAVVEEYRSRVPNELLEKIHKVYESDFQAFSYESI